jgi:pilus assembly protein CpaB
MRISRILLVAVALIAGGLAAWLATRPSGEPAPQQAQVVQDTHSKVLIAKADIGLGDRLSATNLDWQDWPDSAIRPEYITDKATPDAITQMKDAVARYAIFSGEPIENAKLVHTTQGYMSAVLDKGMRGVSISVDASSASGGFIVPNDHVDLILSRSTAEGQQAETLLSNVRVLAINARLGETGTNGAPADPNAPQAPFANSAIATLELDPAQAETVANAVQLGKLSLSLRSIVDFAPDPSDQTGVQRNAPIRIIRFGQEANVMAGTGGGSGAGGVDPSVAALRQPAVSISVGPNPLGLATTTAPINTSTSPPTGPAPQ